MPSLSSEIHSAAGSSTGVDAGADAGTDIDIDAILPRLCSLTERVVLFPVRHHSPACARALSALIRRLRPAAVLVEGPSDFNDRLPELALPHRLPIAIYTWVQEPDQPLRGAFYPF